MSAASLSVAAWPRTTTDTGWVVATLKARIDINISMAMLEITIARWSGPTERLLAVGYESPACVTAPTADIGVYDSRGCVDMIVIYRAWSKGSAACPPLYTEYMDLEASNRNRLCTRCKSCAWPSDANAASCRADRTGHERLV